MSKTLGIIAEYNPFHNGHAHQIEQSLAMTDSNTIVVVMSGNFAQRGGPTIYDKWSRAEQAVEQGVSLVVELPIIYACNSAEYFAYGGVEVLEALGAVDYISFGSECGDIDKLKKIANIQLEVQEDARFSEKVSKYVKDGRSYPKAKELILQSKISDDELSIAKEPNNILALEYIKRIKSINPITVKRVGSGHHKSASEIRNALKNEAGSSLSIIEKNYYKLVVAKILETEDALLMDVFSADEGLIKKVKNEVRKSNDIDSLIMSIKSKAYTYSRISRLMTHILLDIKKQTIVAPSYVRVLAFDDKGATFLSKITKDRINKIPIITNINKEMEKDKSLREKMKYDILAADIYNLIAERNIYDNSEFVQKPYISGA